MDHINDKIAKDYWHKKNNRIVHSKESFSGSFFMDFIIVDAAELSYFYKLTAENSVAEFTVLMALYNMLLQRYFEDYNVLSLKSFLASQKTLLCYEFQSIGQKTIKEFIQETKEEVQEVYKYAPYYADAIIEQTSYVNYIPFQFNYGANNEPAESYQGLSFHIEKLENKDLRVSLHYSEKFTENNIVLHFLKNFKRWLEELEENINISASKIPLISKEEQKALLHTLSTEKCDYDYTITLAGIVERQANKTPQNIAVVCGETALTYESLNEQANQLSHYFIKEHGVLEGDFVGVKLERSEKLIIAILAVLKAGATYVPIDVNYPEERIAYIEKDSKCKLVIDVAIYSDFQKNQVKYATENPLSNRKPDDLAYIIYTSGTTGNPKGVMITHQNAVALIYWAQEEFNLESFDIVYAATSHCFDLSVYEMFYPLSVGKKIKVLNNALEIGAELAKDHKILLNTVPSSIRNILEEGFSLDNVSVINLAGEPFPVDIAKKLLQTNAEIRNLYGPSEDTTYSTCYQLSSEKVYQSIPIGKPITNTRGYILDEELQLVPAGIMGKLYLSGDGVAKGYLNQPELTTAKFIENPFEEGEKMYDTGDLAKWMPDGNLAYLGRKDHQIKLRGYRIELGEIENVMLSFSENMLQAVVAVKKNRGEDVLVGYYIENIALDKTHLRAYLEKQLPAYMIPSYFIKVETVPLTPNGKVNKNALPEIEDNSIVKKEYVAPVDALEKELVQIWEQTLGTSPIGMNDHFFELGGHSLMISQIINAVYKKLHMSVPYKVFYTNPTLSDLRKVLKNQEYLSIPVAPYSESYPLTHSQNRLWLLSQLEGGNEAYQISGAVLLKGNVDDVNFTKAFNKIVERHEILRTFFKKEEEGVVKQFIVPNHEFQFVIETKDFSQEKSPYHNVQDYIAEKDKLSYNLTEAPLFRASLLKIKDDNFVFYLSIHHLISDGWSLKVLTDQVLECYDALQIGETISLPENPVQFKDYAIWQLEEQKKEKYQIAKEFWIKQFEETIPALQLPGYTNRPVVKTYCGNQLRHVFSTELLTELQNLSKDSQVTLFAVLMTGVKTLLSRYSNQDDIVIGTPIAGREHPDLEHQIGLYINTLAIRTSVNQKEGFSALLQREGKQLLEAYEHQSFPFDVLIEQLKISRDTSRSALFDIMVVLQNQHQISNFKNKFSSDIAIEEFEIDRNVAPFDIVFTFTEKETLHLEILYNSDLYSSDFVQGIIKHLENLFYQIVQKPEILLEEIDLVSEDEKEILLHTFNNTDVDFDTEKTVINLFLEQVAKTPQNKAVIANDGALSYAELDELSNRLANYLIQNYKIAQYDLVAVKLERGERLLISLLGILKTGAAYVPVDTNYPENRIRDILNDVTGKVVIDDTFLDDFYCQEELSAVQPQIQAKSTDLAYVIYTSGSTGKPKGVMIAHQSLVNLCFWHKETYGVNETSRGTLFSGVAFDASVWEIYPYLISGATLYPIQKEEIRLQIPMLVSFLQKNGITHSYLPSKICQDIMAEDGLELSTIILTGGESLNYSTTTSLQIYNNYGPTENTVVTTYYDCKKAVKEKVSIGSPISNTRVYILSENLKLQPIGVIGELCVSGIGLSKGYLHQPELTAEKFIQNPFKGEGKLYKTGDLARWLPDGTLEFAGRKDNQVKIRGNRVELSEIEHVIREYEPAIANALVLVKEINKEPAIIAYYTTKVAIDKKLLRDYLKEQLADYMVPSYYIALETLPLNANGKVDISKLPTISEADILKKEYVAPENNTQAKIAVIWQELLGHQKIGITDDFFELGGHSLLLTKLLSEYQKTFKVSIDLKTLYANTTLKNHAVLLNDSAEEVLEIEKLAHQEYYDLSPSQIRYWLLYKIHGKSREFNIYSTFELPDDLNAVAFEEAFNILLKRHEILTSIFVEDAGIPKQKVLSNLLMSIPFFESEAAIKKEVFEHEFDLEVCPLFKVAILKVATTHTLYFNMHHSIGDGWSMGIISRDLMDIYNAIIAGKTVELPELSIQYKEYAQWQNKLLQSPEVTVQENYWKEKLAGPLSYLQLPLDYNSKLKKAETSSSYTVYITEERKKKIEELSRKNGISVFAVFVATLKMLLFRLTSEEDIIIGIPVANRNHYQLKDLVGCFINTLMLRDKISENISFQTWLQEVNDTLVNALVHQNYPFEQLLELIDAPQNDNRFPLSPVFLNMVDFDGKVLETITEFSPNHKLLEATPKFDMECYIKSFANGYSINCVYDHELFKKETIQYWINAYLSIIDQVIENDKVTLQTIKVFEDYISQEEDLKPANDFEFFEADEIQQSIAKRFEKQVERFPNHTAVFANQTALSYKMLNNCANHLARQINEKANPDTKRVALLLNHNETCVIGMLGVLKAGYAYVPIDANSPLSRIQYIIEDSGCNQLVCNDATVEKAQQLQQELPQLSIVRISENYTLSEIPNPENKASAATEAYVLYTSGSTGMPKGVVQNQRNVLHFIRVYTNNVHIAINDNLSVFSTFTFDASVKDIYGAILNGATVSIYDIVENGLDQLSSWLLAQNITIIHMVPTIYRNFLKGLEEGEVLPTVRLIDLGGESCHKPDLDLFKKYFLEGAFLVNDYGPTESTIVAQKFFRHTSQLTRNNMPLGKAVEETGIFLLDENNQQRGVYQTGEITFKSEYLSLGYLNRQELTENVFITDPIAGEGRVYKSGDIGKMLPTGEIEFLQRKDSQVKLNGLRIELSEIEYQLEQIESIKEAVVLLKELQQNTYITAYIRVAESLEASQIKMLLGKILPKYMIPTIYITLEEFPLTRTGKIERKALPNPTVSDLKTVPYVAPKTEIESKLAAIWSEVLKLDIEVVGTEDNFFELGGNSLQAVVLINKINKTYNTVFSIANLYETLNIRDLSALLNFSILQNSELDTILEEQDQDEIIL
ncbi:amino acid adenylation domain-containing protein [Flavobacterium sp. 90]|uniref:non-ribosomal peptide synthetase n=1 Tax=unclassified Flavobacterium TaxID=196869 RepID=UPI000EB09464|nr:MULTISPECIES: non-ribosomal peptide synthetase [unclassified Flavobacterium]RKR12095.1 amino acid adenylation domain-containing protein [Flavobacterium sp. 81]TCK55867.1 amino acid adenylation domain-containing protein [Flavobacterium sp. 90]